MQQHSTSCRLLALESANQMRPSLLNLLLLAAVSGLGPLPAFASESASAVPVLSLEAELTQMDKGTPVFIHTPYAAGIGYLLPSGREVVTARHNVMRPSGDMEMEIEVGVPRAPLDNIEEGTGTPVAQDPARDLVVLRLAQTVHAAASPSASSASSGVPMKRCAGQIDHAVRASARRSILRAARLRRQRHARRLELVMHSKPLRIKNGPALRVVWDGPAAKPAPRVVTTAMVRRPRLRVVQDGPLR